jgi:hypothetical protein
VLGATDRSRQEFEQRFGVVVGMGVHIVESAKRGGWAETYALLADGTVQKVHREGGSPEAERIRNEARQRVGPGSFA